MRFSSTKVIGYLLVGFGSLCQSALAETEKTLATPKKEKTHQDDPKRDGNRTLPNRYAGDRFQGVISTRATLFTANPLNDPETIFSTLKNEFFEHEPSRQEYHSAEVRLGFKLSPITHRGSITVSGGYGILRSAVKKQYDTGTLRLTRRLPFAVLAGRWIVSIQDFVKPNWLKKIDFYTDLAYYLPLHEATVTLESTTYKRVYREERPVLNPTTLNASAGLIQYWGSHWSSEFALGLDANALFAQLGIAYSWGDDNAYAPS